MHKSIIFVVAFLVLTSAGFIPDTFDVDPAASTVQFKVSRLRLVFVRGEFKKFWGRLAFDGENLSGFEGTVDMNSLSTGIRVRDNDLKSDNFFAVARFPFMIIKAEDIIQNRDDVIVKSLLAIRDIPRTVELHGTVIRDGDRGGYLTLQGNISRKDFGLRLNKIFEFFVGDKVNIALKLRAGPSTTEPSISELEKDIKVSAP